jgi:prepilin peptidase CpaA
MSINGDLPGVLEALLVGTVLVAGVWDLRYKRIPNWLNVSALALGFILNSILFSAHGFLLALLGLGCSLLVYLPLYLLRAMGAGDVKLMAAVGAIVGPVSWLYIFLFTALLGGAISLIYVVLRRRFYQTFLNMSVVVTELAHVRLPAAREARLDVHHAEALRLPHGSIIALGAIAFIAFGRNL